MPCSSTKPRMPCPCALLRPLDLELAMTRGVNYPKGLLAWANDWGVASVLEQSAEHCRSVMAKTAIDRLRYSGTWLQKICASNFKPTKMSRAECSETHGYKLLPCESLLNRWNPTEPHLQHATRSLCFPKFPHAPRPPSCC